MAIYGIGCDYDGNYVGDQFYQKKVACIGWPLKDNKDYLFGLMDEIKIGDIVVLKSFFQRKGKQVIRIKAIGIVSNNNRVRVKNLGYGVKVQWLKYNDENLHEFEFDNDKFDGGVQRRTTIYREYNSEICKRIIRLLVTN
jgi:hypothetical protein